MIKRIIIILLFLLDFVAISAYAETDSDRLQEEVTGTIEIRQETQKKEDAWTGKKAELRENPHKVFWQ